MADYIDAERAALLPCPFCGGPVKLEKAHQGRHEIYGMRQFWGIVCRNTMNHGGTCCMEQVPSASPEAAVARWNRRTPSSSIGEDGLPVEVKIERGRVWIVRGNQSFMLAYVPDEGDDPAEMQAYADNLRSALSGFTPCVNSAVQGAASPQAAEGVKTWQERYEEDGHAESGEFYMQDEIADLRAQLARQSQGDEAEIYAIWDAAKAEAAMYIGSPE